MPTDPPHRRYNPLLREWVLVSPQRGARPWRGQIEPPPPPPPPAYDPTCHLCPGNRRAAGKPNPAYAGAFVFDNDYPALLDHAAPPGPETGSPLLRSAPERGLCRVVCYSPRHDLSLPRMDRSAIESLVRLWGEQSRELGARPEIAAVTIFENRGEMMGASNPHPHGQIWANSTIPDQLARELASFAAYRDAGRGASPPAPPKADRQPDATCLLCDYLALERARGERLVCENEGFAALVPYWAVWPFETLVIGRAHRAALDQLPPPEQAQLADLLRRLGARYDNLFGVPFPCSWGFHQAPTDGRDRAGFHLHAHFLPPLLRSATIRKFQVGYELLATPQRDLTAEQAAERLRAVGEGPETAP